MHMYLFQENLRYDKMAEGLGARGEYVRTAGRIPRRAEAQLRDRCQGEVSTLINVQALKEFTSGKDYPPGIALPPEPGVGAFAH